MKKFLIITLLLISTLSVNAEDLFSKDYVSVSSDEAIHTLIDYEDRSEQEELVEVPARSHSKIKSKRTNTSSYLRSNIPVIEAEEDLLVEENEKSKLTLIDLIYRILLMLVVLVSVYLISKAMVEKTIAKGDSFFNEKPGFFNGFPEQFSGCFTNMANLKLKQMINLNKGQNLYLVELDGKKILLGGTHQGGIQYVADLTEEASENHMALSNSNQTPFFLDAVSRRQEYISKPVVNQSVELPKVEELTAPQEHPFKNVAEHMSVIEQARDSEKSHEIASNNDLEKQRSKRRLRPFKRKVSFRQSLISS